MSKESLSPLIPFPVEHVKTFKRVGLYKNCPGGLKSNESISLGQNCLKIKKEQITALIIVLSFVKQQSLKESESPAVPGSVQLDQQPGFSRKILRRISFWRGVGRRWSQRGTSQTWTLRWHPSCLLATFLTPSCASALEWKAQWLAYLLLEDRCLRCCCLCCRCLRCRCLCCCCFLGLKSQKSLFVSKFKSGTHPLTHSPSDQGQVKSCQGS